MNAFAHKDDKGKINLGNESDLTGIGDGTAFGAIKAINNDLAKFAISSDTIFTTKKSFSGSNSDNYTITEDGFYELTVGTGDCNQEANQVEISLSATAYDYSGKRLVAAENTSKYNEDREFLFIKANTKLYYHAAQSTNNGKIIKVN